MGIGLAFLSFLVDKQCPGGHIGGVKPGSDRLQINFSLTRSFERKVDSHNLVPLMGKNDLFPQN